MHEGPHHAAYAASKASTVHSSWFEGTAGLQGGGLRARLGCKALSMWVLVALAAPAGPCARFKQSVVGLGKPLMVCLLCVNMCIC